jgi:hypothetical protein
VIKVHHLTGRDPGVFDPYRPGAGLVGGRWGRWGTVGGDPRSRCGVGRVRQMCRGWAFARTLPVETEF